MKAIPGPVILLVIICSHLNAATPTSGFFLPDSVQRVTFTYNSVHNFVILSALINDSIPVNLMLDTGCRNILLFGKRFSKLITRKGDREITFSGLGNGREARGFVSLENDVKINIVHGKRIPVVVVPNRNVFDNIGEIDGVVGYEIFTYFEVKINFPAREITFTAGPTRKMPEENVSTIPLRLEDAKPIVASTIKLDSHNTITMDLLIDTGSSLSLLITTNKGRLSSFISLPQLIGRGFNGDVMGTETVASKLILHQKEIDSVDTGVIFSNDYHYASIGTAFLKDYVLVLNYARGYASLELPEGDLAIR